ncbi:MAG: plastocyanin/azurin family copper-binding protein [Akkermansiaceae bacterium]
MKFSNVLLALVVAGSFGIHANNIAKGDLHPYADVSGGRENWKTSGEKVNEARLYDFYQRQADYYMANPEKVPEVIPAHPGLDGGNYGHWGKHNQNNYSDERWNDAEMGEVVTQVFRAKDLVVLKGICVRLGEECELSTCFDPMALNYRALWSKGFLKFNGFRWGSSRNAALEGTPMALKPRATNVANSEYLGYRRYGKRVVFEYRANGVRIADEPWASGQAFYRAIDFSGDTAQMELPVLSGDGLSVEVIAKSKVGDVEVSNGAIAVSGVKAGGRIVIRIGPSRLKFDDAAALKHLAVERKYEKRWNQAVSVPGELGKPQNGSAYVVDTFTVPFDNPWKVVMQLTGIGFLETGEALVSTLVGDVWKVSGLNGDLGEVSWSRYATGFNQPIGIHIDDDGVFVLDRGQIYRLHDLNKDGEVDFYENYAHDFGGYDRSHTHTFGLHRTADGAFHFTQRESILRTGPDRKTELQAGGVRNCMGIGGSKDYFWVAPQEGTWTPASAIIEVNKGEFYGLPSSSVRGGAIAPPLCYIPRGVDNSTGGMVEVTSDKWGPFQGNHVGISYGSSTHYLILRDDTSTRPQGAVVPMEGEFLSGTMRGVFHPKDGQLYVVGLDGWGDYAINDGCFHRIRFTNNLVRKPKGFRVHQNGIRIDFTTKLDQSTVEDIANYFGQAWNYEYKRQYGSPEFSIAQPESLGHDRVKIRSVIRVGEGDSIFVEIPDLEPSMQLHLRMHLKGADGHEFKTDLFASPMYPGPAFVAKGLAEVVNGKRKGITLRVAGKKNQSKGNGATGKMVEGARELVVDAIGGLQYAQTELTAKAGEALAWKLRNTDVMPHNLVLVKPGSAKAVGEASFKMLNDPKAGEKNYIPGMPEVIAFIPVIDPETEHVLNFRVPKEPGDYPYMCTFPGHWQAMRGVLKVR